MSKHGAIPTDRKTVLEHIDLYLSSYTLEEAIQESNYGRRAYIELLEKVGIFNPDLPNDHKKTVTARHFGYTYAVQKEVVISL